LEAISSKYIEEQSQAGVETVILGSSKGAIEVEAPGLNKVRSKLSRIENLKEVSLDKEYVAKANEAGQINQRCPSMFTLYVKIFYVFKYLLQTLKVWTYLEVFYRPGKNSPGSPRNYLN